MSFVSSAPGAWSRMTVANALRFGPTCLGMIVLLSDMAQDFSEREFAQPIIFDMMCGPHCPLDLRPCAEVDLIEYVGVRFFHAA